MKSQKNRLAHAPAGAGTAEVPLRRVVVAGLFYGEVTQDAVVGRFYEAKAKVNKMPGAA